MQHLRCFGADFPIRSVYSLSMWREFSFEKKKKKLSSSRHLFLIGWFSEAETGLETRAMDWRTKNCSGCCWEPADSLFLCCFRLQNSTQRDLWEIHQWGPCGHYGALRSWEVHAHEYPGRIQVSLWPFNPHSDQVLWRSEFSFASINISDWISL